MVREPSRVRLFQDACRAVFLAVMVIAVGAAVSLLPRVHPAWIDVLARIIGGLAVHVMVITVLREIVPKPRVGSHRVGLGREYLSWAASTALADVANHPCVRWPYSMFDATRFVYLRAQGARIRYGASLPADLVVRDPCLLSVDAGAQIEPRVVIEHGLRATGRIRVDVVTISSGCLVGAGARIMPGVSLGPDSRVGPSAYLGPDVSIGVGAKIGERAVLAAGVEVGSHARIGAGAVLAEGVVVGDHAKIGAGAVLPPNSRVREGEVWQGVPARPMYRDSRGRPGADSI